MNLNNEQYNSVSMINTIENKLWKQSSFLQSPIFYVPSVPL